MEDTANTVVVHELFFSSPDATEEQSGDNKVIWKDVLREGDFAMTPGVGSVQRKPFRVIANGQSSAEDRVISMSDLIESHRDKAFEHVTIPTRHEDKLLDNTGFVQDLRVVKKGDTHVLQAGLGFTEPDVAGKVRRGTIPNVSCGIFFDFIRKADGRKFRSALKHVALTHTPWINKLEPFKAVLASDDEIEGDCEIEGYQFADKKDDKTADIKWQREQSFSWLRDQIQRQLNPSSGEEAPQIGPRTMYWVEDMAPKAALISEDGPAGSRRFVAPFTVEDSEVKLAASERWTEVKEAMIAASDDTPTDFDKVAIESITEKLTVTLSDRAGSDKEYRVDGITIDKRARIVNKDGAEWVANFSVHEDGEVTLSPSSVWEPIKAAEKKPEPKQKQVALSDLSLSRLEQARQNRRRLMTTNR